MKRLLFLMALVSLMSVCYAQRTMDKLDRGLVAVKVQGGVFCSWRIMGEEYYDVKYNLYRDGTKIAENLEVSNYTDTAGSTSNKYTVSAVVRGKEHSQCYAVSPLTSSWLEVKMDHGNLKSTYIPNDACCADVDGDGELEILLKFDNLSWYNTSYQKAGYQGEYFIIECYKLSGKRLWWIDLGPNMADFQNNEQNIVAYDWDQDGKAEAVMRAADGTTIHMADGTEYVIGDKSKNYLGATAEGQWFVHEGSEFLVYMNGETGKPYQVMDYPLKRLESGETDLNKAWGDGYGHRSTKHFFGAPYLDGRRPSIFLARGIYTRHKMIALDVNPQTHELTERWRWNCNDSSSPYYGQGFHNYAIVDVDWDGRDEICFGGMVIDDNGKGLHTTGLGHGDAQHHGDFDPYSWGQEIYTCQEEKPNNCYRDGTTGKIRYRSVGGDDDGRSMMGNFSNNYPGSLGRSGHDTAISSVTNNHIPNDISFDVNFRIYWDGDLLEETFNGTDVRNSSGRIYKPSTGKVLTTLTGSLTNNDTKGTPCYQGDVFGDWREEVIMRTSENNIRIYTTTTPTQWRNYTLWHDMQYRNAMVWQMCGYNQPPHVSYFLGELEGITQAPPALTMTNRQEIANGGTITTSDQIVMTCETNDMEVNVIDACEPYMFIDNTPSWVQGTNSTSTTNPNIKYQYFTHTLKGGAFAGAMRLVKQGDGKLVLPAVVQKYTGSTDVWAGTLQFDGTLESSPLWLNRHTTLITDGGKFLGGITADYNATIFPGGQEKVGSMTVSSLQLGFGSRVVFDIDGANADQMNVNKLTIEKKVWPNGGGPRYDTPVFQINGNPAAGTYTLGTIDEITGNISDVMIEGLTGKKATLDYVDNKLTLILQDYVAGDLVWTGSAGSIWNIDETANFTNAEGQSTVFVPGSTVTFNDNAQQSNITIQGHVAPEAVIFSNETKNFTISGDSIVGEPTLTKNGTGSLTISNVNHMGATSINGGVVTVRSLANNSGTEYGSLGSIMQNITINNGAVLALSETATSDQTINIGEEGGVISVPAGKTLTQSGRLSGSTLTKKGNGALTLGTNVGNSKLIISAGEVNAQLNSSVKVALPSTVEFQGGTLNDPNNQSAYATNSTNFIVREGMSGTLLCDPRCEYKGTLKGAGTFKVIAAGIRDYLDGDWSSFEGTIVPGLQKRGSYDPEFVFRNSKGLPNATLKLNTGVTFTSTVNIAVADVTGTGTLGGSVTYTIGGTDKNISAGFASTAPIIKKGSGNMEATKAGSIAGGLTVQSGELRFFGSESTAFFGQKTLTLTGSATASGSGKVALLTMENGTKLTPTGIHPVFYTDMPAKLIIATRANIKEGAVLNFLIQSVDSYSSLQCNNFSMNGTIEVTLTDDNELKKGDTFTLWTVSGTFSGTPKLSLPALPAGLYWDTTDLATSGILRVTDDATLGVGVISATTVADCEVFTITGINLGSFRSSRENIRVQVKKLGVTAGTYIVKMSAGRNKVSETVIIR